jgi:hypothetical protein
VCIGYSKVLVTARPHLCVHTAMSITTPLSAPSLFTSPHAQLRRQVRKHSMKLPRLLSFFFYLFCLGQNVPLSALCSNSFSRCYSLRASPFSYLNEVSFCCIEIGFMAFRQFYFLVLLECPAASTEVCTR